MTKKTQTIQALSKLAAAKSKVMYKNSPTKGPSQRSRQLAASIYADMLAKMDETTRYDVVDVIWNLAHAEVDIKLGKAA